jgi:hypothetical protein
MKLRDSLTEHPGLGFPINSRGPGCHLQARGGIRSFDTYHRVVVASKPRILGDPGSLMSFIKYDDETISDIQRPLNTK